jgi:hypothetical protein
VQSHEAAYTDLEVSTLRKWARTGIDSAGRRRSSALHGWKVLQRFGAPFHYCGTLSSEGENLAGEWQAKRPVHLAAPGNVVRRQ